MPDLLHEQFARITNAILLLGKRLDLIEVKVHSTPKKVISMIIDGNGAVIGAGVVGDIEVPYTCIIERVTMLADQSGSMVVDIWKDTYANFPPTIADTITSATPPTITAATNSQDSTLTGWTTLLSTGDVLRFNVNSCVNITRATVSLLVRIA